MSETTPDQIDAIKTMCEELGPTVKEAHVDDWGRYGNFDVRVTPVEHNRSTTRKLIALVRKALPDGAHLRECFPPVAVREKSGAWNGKKKSKIMGYDRDYWTFDIDYQWYDPSINRFSPTSAVASN